MSLQDVREQIVPPLAKDQPSRAAGYAFMLYRFAREVAEGDLVVTPDGVRSELLFGRVVGPYEYSQEPRFADFNHLRKVDWFARQARAELPRELLPKLGAPMAVFTPAAQSALLALSIWNEEWSSHRRARST